MSHRKLPCQADGFFPESAAVPVHQPVHRTNQHLGRQQLGHLDGRRLAVGLVDDIEGAEPAVVIEHTMHKVQGPTLIDYEPAASGTPASPSLRIATIWLSVNLLFLIGLFLSAWAAFSDFSCLLGGGAYGTTSRWRRRPVPRLRCCGRCRPRPLYRGQRPRTAGSEADTELHAV